MSSKLNLSIVAALVLSAAATGVARAEPAGTTAPAAASADETSSITHSTLNAFDAAESGDPNSVNYPNRPISKNSPTSEELNADEVGAPYSPDYRNRPIVSDDDWKAELDSLESGNPNSVEYGDRTHPEGGAVAAAPSAR